jgi:hypothetical protein
MVEPLERKGKRFFGETPKTTPETGVLPTLRWLLGEQPLPVLCSILLYSVFGPLSYPENRIFRFGFFGGIGQCFVCAGSGF